LPAKIALVPFAVWAYHPTAHSPRLPPFFPLVSGMASRSSRRTIVNTLKSAALLVVLLGVLYGVYVALNKPEPPDRSGPSVSENAPVIEFGRDSVSIPTAPASPPLMRGHEDESSAASGRSIRGGSYPSNFDTGAMPPPTTVASTS